MNIPGTSGLESARRDSWFQTALLSLRTNVTLVNLVGLLCAGLVLFLLLVLHEPWNIRLPLYLVVLVWTILRPRTALYLLAVAVPWGSVDTINLHGLNLNSADLLVAFLSIGWLMSFTLPAAKFRAVSTYAGPLDRENSNVPRYLVAAMLALLGTMILSMTVALNITDSLKEVFKWLEFLVLVLLGAQYLRTRRQIWILIVIICLAGISQAAFGYVQAFYNIGPQAFVRDASLRVYGTFGQPNPYAGYLNMPLSIALALLLLGRGWLVKFLAGITAASLGLAIYLSQSRGGELAISVALLFILLVGLQSIRVLFRLFIVVGLAFIEAYLLRLVPQSILSPVLRFLGLTQISLASPSPQDYSTAERLAHWIAGLHMFLDHPLLGVGMGNYPDAYSQYYVTIFVNSLGHAHNYYINIAAEMGIIGLVVYLLFLLAIFTAGARSYRHIDESYRKAKSQGQVFQPVDLAPPGTRNKLFLLLHPLRLIQCYREQHTRVPFNVLTNDRALAIGLLAALITVSVHNLVDDLYVHSLTNLIALLLIALIRLEEVAPEVGGHGGEVDYIEHTK